MMSRSVAPVALGLVVAMTWAQGATSQGAGDPWGARAPAACPALRGGIPSAVQAAQLVRCAKEAAYPSSGELWLTRNVQVQVGPARSFASMYNIVTMANADTTRPVHPISGQWTWSICMLRSEAPNPALNCREATVSGATGACWTTTAGVWRCTMNGSTGPTRSPTAPVR